MPPTPEERWNRRLIGGLALGALVLSMWLARSGRDPLGTWTSSFFRSSLLLGALWLALPSQGRAAAWAKISPWWLVLVAGVLIFAMRSPQIALPVAVGAFLLLAILSALAGRLRRSDRKATSIRRRETPK